MVEAMILLTRLNGSAFAVNPDLVERIQETPDTTVVLVDGTTYIVTETIGEVIDAIAGYRARVLAMARALQYDAPVDHAPHPAGRRLGLIDGAKAPRRPSDASRRGRS
jgi:flagellar protein FlbD